MALSAGSSVIWSDVQALYTRLNTQRTRFGFATVSVPALRGTITYPSAVSDLKSAIQAMTSHSKLTSVASTSGVAVPARGDLLKPGPFNQMSTIITNIEGTVLNSSNFSGFNGANFSGFNGANFSGFNGTNFGFNGANFSGFNGTNFGFNGSNNGFRSSNNSFNGSNNSFNSNNSFRGSNNSFNGSNNSFNGSNNGFNGTNFSFRAMPFVCQNNRSSVVGN